MMTGAQTEKFDLVCEEVLEKLKKSLAYNTEWERKKFSNEDKWLKELDNVPRKNTDRMWALREDKSQWRKDEEDHLAQVLWETSRDTPEENKKIVEALGMSLLKRDEKILEKRKAHVEKMDLEYEKSVELLKSQVLAAVERLRIAIYHEMITGDKIILEEITERLEAVRSVVKVGLTDVQLDRVIQNTKKRIERRVGVWQQKKEGMTYRAWESALELAREMRTSCALKFKFYDPESIFVQWSQW